MQDLEEGIIKLTTYTCGVSAIQLAEWNLILELILFWTDTFLRLSGIRNGLFVVVVVVVVVVAVLTGGR